MEYWIMDPLEKGEPRTVPDGVKLVAISAYFGGLIDWFTGLVCQQQIKVYLREGSA